MEKLPEVSGNVWIDDAEILENILNVFSTENTVSGKKFEHIFKLSIIYNCLSRYLSYQQSNCNR